VQNAVYICQTLLEPVRAQFGPTEIDDGYRPPVENVEAGGKPKSYHLYIGTQSAADIKYPMPEQIIEALDWIRLESGLRFDKVILEFKEGVVPDTPACIHLQIDSEVVPRREGYTGYTGACEHYTPVEVR
jgi:hypothetical protein